MEAAAHRIAALPRTHVDGAAHAMCDLGVCYLNGEGVARDVKRAVELFEGAVEAGVARACVNLGTLLQRWPAS